MKFSIEDFSSKCDQIRKKLRIWSHLLEKSLMENPILLRSDKKRWGRSLLEVFEFNFFFFLF